MLRNYFKTALRTLTRNKTYSFINIAGMAIGITAFWMIALYVADEMSYDRAFSNSDRIVRVAQHARWKGGSMDLVPTSPAAAPAFQSHFPEVKDAARIDLEGGGIIKYKDKIIKQGDICFADNSIFHLFDYHFLYGTPQNALSHPQSIVISETLAAKLFGDPSQALDQTVLFGTDNYPGKITGVIADMPKNSHLQFSALRSFDEPQDNQNWNNATLYTYLLLQNNKSLAGLQQKLPSLEKEVSAKTGYTEYHIELQPLTSIHLHSNLSYELSANGSISRVYMFVAIGILILLIALINYMNLSTARAASRVKEIGVRKVIGSSRTHLVAMFVAESLLVTICAALLAAVLIQALMPAFNRLSGKDLTIFSYGVAPTIGAIVAFVLFIGLISGTYPALLLSKFRTIPSLKGQLGNMHANVVFRKSLVVFQFVIAVFLVSSSFVIYRQLTFVSHKDLGFNKAQVLAFHIDDTKVRNQIPDLKHALLASPFIESVAVSGNPIGNNDLNENSFNFTQRGETEPTAQLANKLYVDEDFLKTAGITLLQGRNFSPAMGTDKDGSVLINETMAKTLGYPTAVGQKVQYRSYGGKLFDLTIIGVVKDFHTYSLQHTIEPLVMMMPPNNKEQDNLFVKIAKGKAAEGIAFLKTAYANFDRGNAADFQFLDDNFERQYAGEQKQEQLSLAFTIVAFVIACMGLLGLVIFATAQRTREIGIRKALGASVASVTLLLSKDFAKLVILAAIIAGPIAWLVMSHWLEGFAYRITMEWWMPVVSAIVAITAALVAVSIQSIRAASVKPVDSLRTE